MSRIARTQSPTGLYHVLLRGVNRQSIFEDDSDRRAFLGMLAGAKEASGLSVLCYCLMGNHVHLLMRAGDEPLGESMKRIAVRYVLYFNAKYERSGHLFQDRFKSEPIKDEGHLLAAVRYICQNPVKAKMCKAAQDYPWSSCRELLGIGKGCTDAEEVLGMFDSPSSSRAQAFQEFLEEHAGDGFIDDDSGRKTDSELKALMRDVSGCRDAPSFQALGKGSRDAFLGQFRQAGFSLRQISRVTGVPLGVVRNK